jgi:SAM-dependent methyltransferase
LALERWFSSLKDTLENAYIQHEEPWRQSGMSGPLERWVSLRKPVAECIDKSGSFLDIGCANGFLLECCIGWTAERHLDIVPYGVDLSEKLLELARRRLPRYKENFFTGNAFYWLPPQRFDFVRTELVYVPTEYEKRYIQFLLKNYLNPGGKLLVANYAEGLTLPEIEKGIMPGSFPAADILQRLKELGFSPTGYKDGFDPVKSRRVRVAILSND